ncbi:protein MIZU-KUSSEI 1 [Euphorbia lathyris]|uniref:protein MIZU-KUSSEI 1 n=1 Tax=Euphorbia lathyris TaxID=212925 RepID=UPI0033138388
MTKIDSLRRFFLPCLHPSSHSSAANNPVPIIRLSTSLRDDLPDPVIRHQLNNQNQDSHSVFSESSSFAPPRPSKTLVVGTIFGNRRGHVWFSIHNDRLSTKPLLLLELSLPTHQLLKEMRNGFVRLALECDRPEMKSCPLRSIPVWTLYCNGKRVGIASRRKASDENRLMFKTMQSMTVGAGVIPAGYGSIGNPEEIMYMRANFEHAVGSANTESFHLISPDECNGQELSVFLMRCGN